MITKMAAICLIVCICNITTGQCCQCLYLISQSFVKLNLQYYNPFNINNNLACIWYTHMSTQFLEFISVSFMH